MKNLNNWIIYSLVAIVLVVAVFVLFQYYSGTGGLINSAKEIEPELVSVQVYYSNLISNPDMLDCSLVYPVERVVTSRERIYEETINQLLVGPNESEVTRGYKTQIPKDTQVNLVKFKDGVLTADFSDKLDYAVGGSCLVSAIRSQIETTMKQWPEVEKTVISINGESEIILQP